MQTEYARKEKLVQKERDNVVSTGLQYYKNRRGPLLEEAEKLCYSKKAIEALRAIDDENWNTDSIDYDTIAALQTMEQFVGEHTPHWKKGLLYRIGKTDSDKGNG